MRSNAFVSPSFRIDPLSLFRDFERVLNGENAFFKTECATSYPAVNVYHSENEVRVVTELPGVAEQDIELLLEGKRLRLKAHIKERELSEAESFIRQERRTGEFEREVLLPFAVEEKKVEAVYRNGLLEVSLPRLAADKPRSIKVKTA